MGSHECLVIVTARNKFWARWRINRLLKWIEKKSTYLYDGVIEKKIVPFDRKKFDEYLDIQTRAFFGFLKELYENIPIVLKTRSFDYEKYRDPNTFELEKEFSSFNNSLHYVQDDVPSFTDRIFYDIKIDWPKNWRKNNENFSKKEAKESYKRRDKGWVRWINHQYNFPEIFGNFMAEIYIRD